MAVTRSTPLCLLAYLAATLFGPAQPSLGAPTSGKAAGDKEGGCGRDFLRNLPDFLGISGHPLPPHEAIEALPALLKACAEQTGVLASVQFAIKDYTSRYLADDNQVRVHEVLQRLVDYYTQQLSEEELRQVESGVALCMPRSCAKRNMPDELSHVAVLYFACMANGRCQDAELIEEPRWQDEINVTFVRDPADRIELGDAKLTAPLPPQPALKSIRTTTGATPSVGVNVPKQDASDISQPAGDAQTSASAASDADADRVGWLAAATEADGSSLLLGHAAQAAGKKKKKRGSGCGKDFLHQLRHLVPISGQVYENVDARGSKRSSLFLKNTERCQELGSRFAKVEFDIRAYIQRGLSEATSQETADVLGRLSDFYGDRFSEAELKEVTDGIALCLPASCGLGSLEDLARVSILYFVCMAGATCQGAELVSEPKWNQEINVTFPDTTYMLSGSLLGDTAASQASSSRPKQTPAQAPEEQPKGDLGKSQGARPLGLAGGHIAGLPAVRSHRTKDEERDSQVAPGLGALSACCGGPRDGGEGDYLGKLQGTGFRAPWWLSCYDLDGWERWAWMARKGLKRRRQRRKVMIEAEKVIKKYERFAAKWIEDINDLQQRGTCKLNYMVFQSETMEEESFHLLQYAFAPRQDMRWRAMPEWADHWGTFCPMGYAAALAARAYGAKEAGLLSFAKEDFDTARDMLGACSELDLLDRHLFSTTSGDIDKELLRMHLVQERKAEGSGGPRKARVWMSHSEAEREVREVQWHALHLNSLVRLELYDVAQRNAARSGGMPSRPKLAMLATPPHLSVMWIPILEHAYGDDLPLTLLYLGLWEEHEKCKSCMAEYRRKYVVEDPVLKSIPYNTSKSYVTGSGGIIWDEGYTMQMFEDGMREIAEKNRHVRDADVFLCNAPTWICVVILLVGKLSTISLNLFKPTLGAPESLTEDTVKKWHVKMSPLQHGEDYGDSIRSLVVVDEPMRGYNSMWSRNFYPFVSLLSMYITERYECRGDVLVMREGSYGRFSVTLRGRVFFAALAQFVTDSSPFRFRQLPYSSMRLSYRELSRHRAAIFVPLMPGTKVTFKDLITMQVPLFMPGMELQASISAHWTCIGQYEDNAPPWVLTQCRTEEKEPWLRLSGFFRHPHVQHFDSLTELVAKLAAMDCTDLTALSQRMGRWNEALIADDAVFWRTAIAAMVGGDARAETPASATAVQSRSTEGSSSSSSAISDTVASAAAWPRPELRIPYVENVRECEAVAPEAEFCKHHRRGEEWTQQCCGTVMLLHERHPFQAQSAPPEGTPAEGRCLWQEADCDERVINYATHLLKQDLKFEE